VTVARPAENESRGAAKVPLSRNINYNILWLGQLFSEVAVEIAMIAFPLLILARSGSVLDMGMASSALAAAHMAAVVPAGAIADRWDRRRVLLTCQVVRAAGMTSLVVALATGTYWFPLVLLVMLSEGLFGSVFDPAEQAALPQVVPESQMSTAVARNMARPYIATLLGPGVAGFLFTLSPMSPFLADAVMLTLSFAGLVFLRLPRVRHREAEDNRDERPEDSRDPDDGPAVCHDVAAGFRWTLGNGMIRASLLWVMFINFIFSALLIIIIAMSHDAGVSADVIGLMMACLGAGGVLGATFTPRLHAALPARLIVVGFSWIVAAASAVMAVVPAGVPLGLLLGVAAFLAPLANTAVLTRLLLVTPDDMRGRLSGIAGFCSGGAGALGPVAGGLLMSMTGGGAIGVLVCAAAFALIAVGATLSPNLRWLPATQE
jgi:MFS family permease